MAGDAKYIDTLAPSGFNLESNNSNWTSIFQSACDRGGTWILPERTYKIYSTLIVKQDGTKFVAEHSGAVPEVRFVGSNYSKPRWNGTSVIACCWWIASKTRFTGIRFTLESPDSNKDKAVLNFQRVRRSGSSASEADMDSSVDNCSFSDIRTNLGTPGAGAINWMGRNMRISGCTFSSGGGSGDIRSISLSYALGSDSDGQSATTGGHRKNIIRDNTFHLTKTSIAIELYRAAGVLDNTYCYGLLISSNMLDVGGSLLVGRDGARARGLTVTGNSCFRGKNTPYLHFFSGFRLEASSFSGNSFINEESGAGQVNNGIVSESGSVFNRVAISGNCFCRPASACIDLKGSSNKIAISGNCFEKEDRSGVTAIKAVGGSGVITGNASNLPTFTSVPSGWIVSNNI